MPHTLLEVSEPCADRPDLQAFWDRLHGHLADSAPCRLQDIKSRAYRCPEFRVGAGDPGRGFVHLTIRLMEGRDPETLGRIGSGALELLKAAFPLALAAGADLTVELAGMRRDAYFKA
jgi:5-carboxymethyl-2-hydroxymuconate isomerase